MPLVFSTAAYRYMAEELCAGHENPFALGELDRKFFGDGERYLRFISEVYDEDVVIIGGTISEADTTELYDLASTAVDIGARSLRLVIPYYGYSTMERAVKPGECVTAKSRARLLSSIPRAPMGNTTLLFDLHADTIAGFFEGNMRARSIHCEELNAESILMCVPDGDDYRVLTVDGGRLKWVGSIGRRLNARTGTFLKERDQEATTMIGGAANLAGAHAVFFDDMGRSLGSACGKDDDHPGPVREAKKQGAKSVSLVITHGVLCGDALETARKAGITRIVTTNSHPHAVELAEGLAEGLAGGLADGQFLIVRSMVPLIRKALENPAKLV